MTTETDPTESDRRVKFSSALMRLGDALAGPGLPLPYGLNQCTSFTAYVLKEDRADTLAAVEDVRRVLGDVQVSFPSKGEEGRRPIAYIVAPLGAGVEYRLAVYADHIGEKATHMVEQPVDEWRSTVDGLVPAAAD